MMDARFTRQELGFPLPANQPSGMQDAEALRLDAAHAGDVAVGRFFRRALRGAWSGLKALATLPRRMAVYDELSALTDRELADIGMKRGDIRYVFDEAFVASSERSRTVRPLVAANTNEGRTAAAA